MNRVIVKNLTKMYGKNTIINNFSFQFDNKYYNFLVGPNGTGKSTLIKCMLGYVNYCGEIIKGNLKFAYAPDKINLPDYISIYNLLLLLLINKKIGIEEAEFKIKQMLEIFQMEKYKNTSICKLSKGTKQKVVLIQCLLSEADVYIFDEPLNGLDIISRTIFIEEIKKLKKLDKIILISTHHLNDYKFRNKKIVKFPLKGEIKNEIINKIA